ncbi:hypothetical protein HK101_001415 [Irineochytrium annulatum]|nr:hypothetical protein HK101_001415 [Irineochytrium annulatum]
MLYETTDLVLQFQKAALAVDVMMVSASCALFGRKIGWALHRPYIPSRVLVLISLFLSWIFNVCATLLIIYSYNDPVACDIAILYCAILYATNKIVIYLFLIEKAHAISGQHSRWGSTQYLFNMGLLIPFCAVEVLMLIYRIYTMDPNSQQCHVGLHREASLPLILYDFCYSQWLNMSFFGPLMDFGVAVDGTGRHVSDKIKRMCRRTLICSILSFASSFANMLTLVVFDSGIWSFVCLTGCMGDSTVQACLLTWVTAYSSEDHDGSKSESKRSLGRTTIHGKSVGGSPTKSVGNRSAIEMMCTSAVQLELPSLPALPTVRTSKVDSKEGLSVDSKEVKRWSNLSKKGLKDGAAELLVAEEGRPSSWHDNPLTD